MKNFYLSIIVVTIINFQISPLFAQENTDSLDGSTQVDAGEENVQSEEVDESETASTTTSIEATASSSDSVDTDSTVLTNGDVNSSADLQGEVVGVTDDTVIIKKEDGSEVVISKEVYKNESGISGDQEIEVGQKVESGTIALDPETFVSVVVTSSKTYPITSSTKITKDGQTIDLFEVEPDDSVSVIIDKDGNLKAIEILSAIDKASHTALTYTLITLTAILVALMGYMFLKRSSNSIVG